MRLKLIACNVFLRELCLLVSRSPHVFDLEFNRLAAHRHSESLRTLIQSKIDATVEDETVFDAILLGYGLCGNATLGLAARETRLVIPRAHDCCTLLMGSRSRFREHFADNPSQPFSSTGYAERSSSLFHEGLESETGDTAFQEYVEKYGEENARYICDALRAPGKEQNRIVFIDIPETTAIGAGALCRSRADSEGKEFVRLEGSLDLLRKFVDGEWDDDFLIVEPGQKVAGVYDWEQVIRAEDADRPE